MQILKGFIGLLLITSWATPAFSADSYYFANEEKRLKLLPELVVTDWKQSRTVLEQSWLSSEERGRGKFDMSKMPIDQLIDPKGDHLDLLSYSNVTLINATPAQEQKLVSFILNGDSAFAEKVGFVKFKATMVLRKLAPQDVGMIKTLMPILKTSKSWITRQNIAAIFVKASPHLDKETVNELKTIMVKDDNSIVRGFAALAVLLNSEDNMENLKQVANLLLTDQRDIAHILRPWYIVREFLAQKNNRILETPSRRPSGKLIYTISELVVREYATKPQLYEAGSVRNAYIRLPEEI